jgi:hypothetical protein
MEHNGTTLLLWENGRHKEYRGFPQQHLVRFDCPFSTGVIATDNEWNKEEIYLWYDLRGQRVWKLKLTEERRLCAAITVIRQKKDARLLWCCTVSLVDTDWHADEDSRSLQPSLSVAVRTWNLSQGNECVERFKRERVLNSCWSREFWLVSGCNLYECRG